MKSTGAKRTFVRHRMLNGVYTTFKLGVLTIEAMTLGIIIFVIFREYLSGEILIQCSSSVIYPNASQPQIRTREYQIKLDPKQFADRLSTTKQWMETAQSASANLELSGIAIKSSVRTQYQLDASACYTRRYFRVRNYHAGLKRSTSTIDIKVNSMFHEKACNYPLWPAEGIHEDRVVQKCEEDVHQCKRSKYSRGTRISFPEFHEYETCYDLAKLFPYDFTHLRTWELQNKVKIDSTEYWWIGNYDGVVSDMNFTFSFTLRYPTVDEALSESSLPNGGELSIRVYTRDSGYSEHWDEESLAEIERIWNSLIHKYGNKEC